MSSTRIVRDRPVPLPRLTDMTNDLNLAIADMGMSREGVATLLARSALAPRIPAHPALLSTDARHRRPR